MSNKDININAGNRGGIKPLLITFLIIIVIGGIGFCGYYIYNLNNKKWADKYFMEVNNSKAKQAELDNLHIVLQQTTKEFKESKDSSDLRIKQLLKKNNININKISALYSLVDSLSTKDTIVFRDTIFQKNVDIDTLLVKPDYTLRLKLKYPSYIETTPSFIVKRDIIFKDRKETVEPKKPWPLYWFQKKQVIIEAIVLDSNEYIQNKEQKFIHIIK